MVKVRARIVPEGNGPADSGFQAVRAVADAVLYEGYLLYPYRRSSPKNRVRWQFGLLAPRSWVEAQGPVPETVAGSVESWRQQTECLFEAAPDALVHVRVRYLRLERKGVERRIGDGRYQPVESLEIAGTTHLSFDGAVPREIDRVVPLADLLANENRFSVGVPGGEDIEVLADGAGRVVRRRYPIEAEATLHAHRLEGPRAAYRLRLRIENSRQAVDPDTERDEALRHTLIATHSLLGGSGVEFLSQTDPPAWAQDQARICRNLHTFPVLAGERGSSGVMLSSPIILPDHPQIAPESPGDLHDAAEIDEILSLRTLLLTDEEKREARATDRRAAEILDRVDGMPPEMFARLHGAIRSLGTPRSSPAPEGPLPPRSSAPWWQEGGDEGLSPTTDQALVDGVPVARGSRVRLRPTGRGADAQDMFLVGRTAQVEAVLHDVDGSLHVAVTIEDDPAADLHGWYGRFRYFRPDELEQPATPRDEERSDGRHLRPIP